MKPQSEEVKYRRWNMIGHIFRQDRNNCNELGPRREKKEEKAEDNMATNS